MTLFKTSDIILITDAIDSFNKVTLPLGSIGNTVQVRVLSPAPKLHTDFDTMIYQNGVQFFYVKTLDFKGFSIIFND